jgi:UDP-GlcNAc3NAcA epimerase
VVTDSGGLQKEAYFFETPCVTVRDSTEWTELVDAGVNRLVPAEPHAILEAALTAIGSFEPPVLRLYGDGNSAEVISRELRMRVRRP